MGDERTCNHRERRSGVPTRAGANSSARRGVEERQDGERARHRRNKCHGPDDLARARNVAFTARLLFTKRGSVELLFTISHLASVSPRHDEPRTRIGGKRERERQRHERYDDRHREHDRKRERETRKARHDARNRAER